MENCTCCFTDTLAKCEDTIQVNAMLQPSTAYRWVITDKFQNKYQGNITTDVNGFFEIDVEDLPSGLLNQYNGTLSLQVFAGLGACSPEKFKIAGVHDCIQFEISGGTFEKNNLGCDFNCNPYSTESALIPFTDA